MQVEIDPHSGFCGGVIRAISEAERLLEAEGGRLYSLGAIVHNEEELARLQQRGLVTLDKEDLQQMSEPVAGEPLLIRAHGEPPQVYERARELGFRLTDCTCPVVLGLQKEIREAHARLLSSGGRIVIFGKIGHPEVLGLVGQVDGGVTVVETPEQLRERIQDGSLPTDRDIELFSQTTMSPEGYRRVRQVLEEAMAEGASLSVHDTICRQVASRHRELSEFARAHDVIVFVSGRESSNGKVLCELCSHANIRTWHIGSAAALRSEWFRPEDRVGVCGATSTPKWLLEEVASAIKNLQ